MGEYAELNGKQIKIGTCEDMYYLRFDQRALVRALRGNVDPVKDVRELRFRFPWPDEDRIPVGGDYHANGFGRAITVPGFSASTDCEHSTIQFSARAGYLVSLPCPESGESVPGLTIHRNGFAGAVALSAQKYVEGIGLVPILRCGGCGSLWREEDRARIEEIAVRLRAEADAAERRGRVSPHGIEGEQGRIDFYNGIADRILAGIGITA